MMKSNSVVCYITSVNPPLHIVKGFVKRIWKNQEIDRIGMVNRGVFLVRFTSKDDQKKACNMNDILFDKKPFIVKSWKVKISLEKEDLATIPIWVHLPALPMEYWGERCIRKIVGLLGNVIKVDNATKNKDRLMYARA